MIILAFYCLILILVNILFRKILRTHLQVLGFGFFISASLCGIYQTANYLFYGPDKFIAIAIAIQFAGSFIFSVLFGLINLKVNKTRA